MAGRKTEHQDGLKALHKALVNQLTVLIKNNEATAAHLKVAADLLRSEGVLAAMLDNEDRATIEDVLGSAGQRLGADNTILIDEDGQDYRLN